MRKLANFLAIIVVLVLITVPVFSSENQLNLHMRIANEWRKSIINKASKVKSQEADRIVYHLENSFANGRPRVDSVEALESKKQAGWILFVPVMKGERGLCEIWKNFSFFSPAQFVPSVGVIVIDGDAKYSGAGKAIALAREYYRAFYHSNNFSYEEDYWLIEKDAQHFQRKFLSFLGGKKYDKLIYEEAQRITKEISRRKNTEIGYFLPGPTSYDKRQDKIFGKPASKAEEDYLQWILWVNAIFVFIENDSLGNNVAEQKAEFLESLNFYKDGAVPDSVLSANYGEYYLFKK